MQKYCAKLHFQFEPLIDLQRVYELPPENTEGRVTAHRLENDLVNPQFLELCSSRNLELFSIRSFVRRGLVIPNVSHIDGPFTGKSRARINWIGGSRKSVMHWYAEDDFSDNHIEKKLNASESYYRNFKITKPLYTEKTDGWYIVETAVAHRVENLCSDTRTCLTFFFRDKSSSEMTTFDELHSAFSDFVIDAYS